MPEHVTIMVVYHKYLSLTKKLGRVKRTGNRHFSLQNLETGDESKF